MKVVLASEMGFCYGVSRAVDMAVETKSKTDYPVYTLGPLIHNPEEIRRLRRLGIHPVEELHPVDGAKLVIRAHGASPDLIRRAREIGYEVIDATCPFVKRAQRAATEFRNHGFEVVIVGDPEHPEVKGILDSVDGQAYVIRDAKEAGGLPPLNKVGVVAQTTQKGDIFNEAISSLRERIPELKVENTICTATYLRQKAAKDVAKMVDVMIVVGGRTSANTRRLFEIAADQCREAYLVETAGEVQPEWFKGKSSVGIAAGASTPDWVIKEVIGKVEQIDGKEMEVKHDEESNVESEQARPQEQPPSEVEVTPDVPAASQGGSQGEIYENTFPEVHNGDIIHGKVVSIDPEVGVMVDIGYKSEGVVPPTEFGGKGFSSETTGLHPGDEVAVMVVSADSQEGVVKLSKRRADESIAFDRLEQALQNREEIQGKVVQEVKGGLVVDVGVRGFVPASQIERSYVPDLSVYVGKTLRLKVLEVDRSKNRVVLSQKVVLEEERERQKQKTWETVEEGQVRSGVVKSITDFGAFIDIGGVDGLLHVSEMSWGRVSHPSEVVKEGQELNVKILKVDREKGRISLGLKQTLPDPWENVSEKYPVDSVVEGKITRLAPFGAFVELEPGVEGLIHISELSYQKISAAADVVKPGDVVAVRVLRVRPPERRISLSLRQANEAQDVSEDVSRQDNNLAEDADKPEAQETETQADESSGNYKIGEVVGDILKDMRTNQGHDE